VKVELTPQHLQLAEDGWVWRRTVLDQANTIRLGPIERQQCVEPIRHVRRVVPAAAEDVSLVFHRVPAPFPDVAGEAVGAERTEILQL
jgi:hypothetical protein